MDRRSKLDIVKTNSSTYSIAFDERIENLTYTGKSNFQGTGNNADNIMTGGIGNDTLDGSSGADTLIGGKGNDVYVVDSAGDVVTELSGQGTDEIKTSLSSYSIANVANVENITYTGSANFSGTGNSLGNVLTGGSGNDLMNGGSGSDDLIGNAGNDTLQGGRGSDWISGGNGDDRLESASGLNGDTWDVDTLIGGAGDDTFVYNGGGKTIINDFAAGETLLISLMNGLIASEVNVAYDAASGDSTITFDTYDTANFSVVLLDYDATSLAVSNDDGFYVALGGDFA